MYTLVPCPMVLGSHAIPPACLPACTARTLSSSSTYHLPATRTALHHHYLPLPAAATAWSSFCLLPPPHLLPYTTTLPYHHLPLFYLLHTGSSTYSLSAYTTYGYVLYLCICRCLPHWFVADHGSYFYTTDPFVRFMDVLLTRAYLPV